MKLEVTEADRPEDDRIPVDHLDFKLCPTCDAKTGSAALCPSCVHNREVIYRLQSGDQDADGPTVADVLAARRKMDKRITKAIKNFETKSGLVVDAVSVDHIDARHAGDTRPSEMLVSVSADVRLPR